jgi:rsbT co-antagonist protein RsbR
MPNWTETYNKLSDDIVDTAVTTLQRELPPYAALPREEVAKRVRGGMEPFVRDFDEARPHHFADYWQNVSYQRAQQGLPLPALLKVLLLATQVLIEGLKQSYADDPPEQVKLVEKAYAVQSTGIASVYAGFEQHKDEIIATQNTALEEISSPIVPIYEGILVLPMIGSIDSRRAGQVMEGLLEGINTYSADVVILDITGVPVIDTGVANYLLQAARAARLLGSTVVLVGIGAEIAQTIVQLGIDLTGIVTRANLQSGIEYALSKQGLAIRPK